MTQPQKNSALALAIVAGLISLPLVWTTIQDAEFELDEPDLQEAFGDMFDGLTVEITGFSGRMTIYDYRVPMWVVVSVTITASLMQIMDSTQMFAVPRVALWIAAIAAFVFVALVIGIALFSGKATMGLGSLFGFISAAIPVLCLALPTSSAASRDPVVPA